MGIEELTDLAVKLESISEGLKSEASILGIPENAIKSCGDSLICLIGLIKYKYSKDNLDKYIAGKTVTVQYQKKDKYKRILGTIYYNNKDINLQQVKDGYAWVYKKYSNNQTYYKEETKAKESKKGLWIEKNPVAPWEFRKQKR